MKNKTNADSAPAQAGIDKFTILLDAAKAVRDGWGKNLTAPMRQLSAAIDFSVECPNLDADLLLATQRAAIECAEQRDALAEALKWIVTRLERGGKAATSDAIAQARAALALVEGGAK